MNDFSDYVSTRAPVKGATPFSLNFSTCLVVSTRAPVKGATFAERMNDFSGYVSTRAPVKGATGTYLSVRSHTFYVSTRAPVKGATAIIKTAVFSRRYIS